MMMAFLVSYREMGRDQEDDDSEHDGDDVVPWECGLEWSRIKSKQTLDAAGDGLVWVVELICSGAFGELGALVVTM